MFFRFRFRLMPRRRGLRAAIKVIHRKVKRHECFRPGTFVDLRWAPAPAGPPIGRGCLTAFGYYLWQVAAVGVEGSVVTVDLR